MQETAGAPVSEPESITNTKSAKRFSSSISDKSSIPGRSAGIESVAQFQSSLSYCDVHDFAYPDFHPLHYGVVLEPDKKGSRGEANSGGSASASGSGAGGFDDYDSNEDDEFEDVEDNDDDDNYNYQYNNDNDGPPWEQDADLASPVVHSRTVGDRISREYEFSVSSIDEIHGRAVALFDFIPENDNEAPLKAGQIVWVSYRHGQGWLVAEDPHSGETGLVPEEYVQMLNASDIYHSPEPAEGHEHQQEQEHDEEGDWEDEGDGTKQVDEVDDSAIDTQLHDIDLRGDDK